VRKISYVIGDELLGRFVPMVQVVVGHDDRIYDQNLIHGDGKLHCWVHQVIVGRSRKCGECALGRQHRINEKAGACVFDDDGGVADLLKLHGGYLLVVAQVKVQMVHIG